MSQQSQGMWNVTLIAAMASIAACDIAFGLTLQLQPLILEAQGVPAGLIGLIVAMGPLGILLAGPFLPHLIGHFGTRNISIAAIITIFCSLFLFKLLPALWWWIPLRFMFGIATGTLFTVSETWVVTMSAESSRARIMGIYSSILSLTFGIGPTIIPFTGIGGWSPWLICMGFVALGLLPLSYVKNDTASHGNEKGNIIDVIKRQPLIFACAVSATLFDAILIAFFSIYAIREGQSLEQASTLLGVAIIGGVALYYPLGILADRWSRDGVVMSCAALTIILGLLVILTINTIWIWPILLLFCVTGFGVYVIALATIGTAFKGKDIVAASAAIAATWGVGGIVGPPIAGQLIDNFGAGVVPFCLIGIYFLLTAMLLFNGGRVLKPDPKGIA